MEMILRVLRDRGDSVLEILSLESLVTGTYDATRHYLPPDVTASRLRWIRMAFTPRALAIVQWERIVNGMYCILA